MSGHMTMMSRGSRSGSSASRCRMASRRTSTWRPRPWQECTRMLSSSRASIGRASTSRPGRGQAIVPDVVLDPLQQGGLARCALLPSPRRRGSRPRRGRAASRGRRGPTRRAAGCARPTPSGPPDVAGAWCLDRRAAPGVSRARETGGGGRDGRRAGRRRRRGRRGSWRAAGSARTTRIAAGGRGGRTPPAVCRQALSRCSAGLGRPMRSPSSRHSSNCQAASSGSGAPAAQRWSMSGRCTA